MFMDLSRGSWNIEGRRTFRLSSWVEIVVVMTLDVVHDCVMSMICMPESARRHERKACKVRAC